MSYDFIILTSSKFDKSAYRLSKKYLSLPEDLKVLKKNLTAEPLSGIPLGKNCYKIRIAIKSKQSGKSGGARVITYVKVQNKRITLLDIYDKSEKENITDKELEALIKSAP